MPATFKPSVSARAFIAHARLAGQSFQWIANNLKRYHMDASRGAVQRYCHKNGIEPRFGDGRTIRPIERRPRVFGGQRLWTPEEDILLLQGLSEAREKASIARDLGRTWNSCYGRWCYIQQKGFIPGLPPRGEDGGR